MYLSNVSMCFFCRPQHLIQYPRTDGDRHLQQLRLPRTAAPCATGKVQHPARSYLTPMYCNISGWISISSVSIVQGGQQGAWAAFQRFRGRQAHSASPILQHL